jgi:DNA topoisomerase-1
LKNLIIVESPAKARTIKGFLGNDYEVIASRGHIRDLPKSSFGIKIEDGVFTPEYRVSRDHSKVVKEIKDKAKGADTVYIATDEDREGEAIGYHIAKAIGKDPLELPRIVFHEITKSAIAHSLENPRKIDTASFDAQQARRLLDRIVGYKLSPLLNSKIQKGLSAGRVQSSALKIVVDREREIKAFVKEEFWTVSGIFDGEIESKLFEYDGKKIEKMSVGNEKSATDIKSSLEILPYKVTSIETKSRSSSPPPPFMTSTLQQSASSFLGFSPRRTMSIAQKLYEGVKTDKGISGLITYMRTDSLNIAKEAIGSARGAIKERFGDKYLPKSSRYYKSKNSSAQEAHEAIRPTMVDFTPEKAKSFLEPEEYKLYSLIYNRFLASQMNDAKFELQNITFTSDRAKFKANGRKLIFDGFYKLMGNEDKDKLLPTLKEGEDIALNKIDIVQNFTEPPPRYSEASLIKKLESLGIGRPSTYAPTVSLLTSRDYIKIEKKQILPQEIAFTVTKVLEEHFPNIVDSSFTSAMEEDLDQIAEDKKEWQKVLKEFYDPFIKKIDEGKKNIKSQKVATPTGESCPQCESELVLRKGRFGEFVACSNFPKCKYTKNIKSDNDTQKVEPQKIDVKCPECNSDIIKRKGRRGDFYGCSSYPKCKFISNNEPVDKKCPECGYMMAKRDYRKKAIFECIKCKHREDA